jgi:hypothetical protein
VPAKLDFHEQRAQAEADARARIDRGAAPHAKPGVASNPAEPRESAAAPTIEACCPRSGPMGQPVTGVSARTKTQPGEPAGECGAGAAPAPHETVWSGQPALIYAADFALWSDGRLQIDAAGINLILAPGLSRRLIHYLDRTLLPSHSECP